MKIKDIRDRDDQGLLDELTELSKQVFTLRTQAVTEKLENPSLIGKTRRDIARIKTVQRERQIKATKAAAKSTVPANA